MCARQELQTRARRFCYSYEKPERERAAGPGECNCHLPKKKKKYREKQLRQQDKELESLCSPCCRQLRRFALFYFSFGQRSRSESTLFLFAIAFSPVSAAKISESPGAALSCVVERTARPRERALADACQGLGGGGGPSSANNQNRLGPAV